MKRAFTAAALLLCMAVTGCARVEETAQPKAECQKKNNAGEAEFTSGMKQLSSEPAVTSGRKEGSKLLDVENILQNPELPTGCECVSLTMVLNYLGCTADKLDIARYYLPKMDFYYEDGEQYGADFRRVFAGDPEKPDSYGCYAPCIAEAASAYIESRGFDAEVTDITGTGFDKLLTDYIDEETPVLIWVTSNDLHETEPMAVWKTPEGEEVQWKAYEHCVVLTGYDEDNSLIYVSDPLYGSTFYDRGRITERYNDMGKQAVCIVPEK